MDTNIPPTLQEFIDTTIGHTDYAPYVLDGQTASTEDNDYHDVVTVIEDAHGTHVLKFTMHPNFSITHYTIKD